MDFTLGHHGDLTPERGNRTCEAPPGLAFACLRPMAVSEMFPFSVVFLAAVLIVFSLLKQFVLENYMLHKDSLHGRAYARLKPRDQRTLVNHHLSLVMKVCLFIIGIYPFCALVSGHNFNTHFVAHLTTGDVLFLCSHTYTAIYIFELCYRQGISYITWVHHSCTILIAQLALAFTTTHRAPDTTIEMTLCLVWGVFDILSEAITHLTMVLYRLYPTRHDFLYRALRIAFVVSALSTAIETAVVGWFYGALFHRWSTLNKALTPMLFIAFVAAQIWSAICLWRIGSAKGVLMRGGGGEAAGEEGKEEAK
ncbi:hypothetical protein PMIN06_007762 [Paraphaeosphaeria minitans]|uniref:Uncharacterized protein n=1 Tax=Paraphaeosphaeria minitans TaxID=565426 RepID=A0A9P6GPS8_9PLEO|nr:hypothetical protein PMIN01_01607 [Paraphaeosphaeria minitans]